MIDTKSHSLSRNNKLQDFTKSGFLFIVLCQFEFHIPTHSYDNSLLGKLIIEFCGVKLHVECSNEYFNEDKLLSMEVEDLFNDSDVENSYNQHSLKQKHC